jgi:hypothetical protein
MKINLSIGIELCSNSFNKIEVGIPVSALFPVAIPSADAG